MGIDVRADGDEPGRLLQFRAIHLRRLSLPARHQLNEDPGNVPHDRRER